MLNKSRLYKSGLALLVIGLISGSYKCGYFLGSRTTYLGGVINAMAKIQYSLAFREGMRRGMDLACGGQKDYLPNYDEMHPPLDEEK